MTTSRYRWAVLAAGTLAQTTYSAIWFGVAVMAPALRSQLGLSLGETGILISASLAGSLVSLIPWGLATDRVGERRVLIVGLGLCGGALLGATQVRGFAALAALLAAAGLTGASVQSASGRAVMHWFPSAQRGVALGIRQTAIPLSGFAVSLGLPETVRLGGVSWGFAALGLFCLVGAAAGGAVVRDTRPPERDDAGSPPPSSSPLRDRRLIRLSAGSALVLAPQLCVAGFAVVFLHDHRGLSAAGGARALAVMQLLAIAGRIGAGRWSDVSGSRVGPLRAIALAAAVLVALTGALVDAPLAALLPALVVAGALSMSWNSLSFAAAVELAGHGRSGSAIGIQQTILNLPSVFYPALFGTLVAATTWRAGFLLVALVPVAGWYLLRPLGELNRSAAARARAGRGTRGPGCSRPARSSTDASP